MTMIRALQSAAMTVIAGGLLASCTARRDPAPRPGLDPKDVPAWRARVTQDRADKDHEFATSPTSPLAGIERFTPAAAAHIAVDGDTVRMTDTAGPGTLVTFQPLDAKRWTWRAVAPDVVATTADGKTPLAPGEIVKPALFRLSGRFHLLAQISAGSFAPIAFDAARTELTGFSHLAYYDPDPRLVVTATLERFDAQAEIELATSRGLKKPYVRYGTLRFAIDGRPCALTALHMVGAREGALFVPFRDATSGKASYGAARYLDLELPADGAGSVTLDFNAAYNPYCAYSPAWNCTLPPPENELAVAIAAGERTFGHGAH